MTLLRSARSFGIRAQSPVDHLDSAPGCNGGTLRIRSVEELIYAGVKSILNIEEEYQPLRERR
jgi:hypothetical protein